MSDYATTLIEGETGRSLASLRFKDHFNDVLKFIRSEINVFIIHLILGKTFKTT